VKAQDLADFILSFVLFSYLYCCCRSIISYALSLFFPSLFSSLFEVLIS
jgi:hypothetical protein